MHNEQTFLKNHILRSWSCRGGKSEGIQHDVHSDYLREKNESASLHGAILTTEATSNASSSEGSFPHDLMTH